MNTHGYYCRENNIEKGAYLLATSGSARPKPLIPCSLTSSVQLIPELLTWIRELLIPWTRSDPTCAFRETVENRFRVAGWQICFL